MRRFQNIYDEDLSSYQRDGHLRHSKHCKLSSDDVIGSNYSRSSTPSSTGSFSRDCRADKRYAFFTKKRRNTSPTENLDIDEMCPDDSLKMHFYNHGDQVSDSLSLCDSFDEEDESQHLNEYAIHGDPVVPEYFEASDLPLLALPKSSTDLHIDDQLIMPLLGIYEILKRFHRHLRLSHFRFEDFCVAIQSSNQSPLLAEIYICLTKALLRADDNNNFVYGPHDVKDSINIFFYSIDYMSWYDILRSYIESSCPKECEDIICLLNKSNFLENSLSERVSLMQCLADLFLKTDLVREELCRESCFQHEDQCRLCHKLGDLLCCEVCPAVYHLECVNLTEVPQGDWICSACKQSEVAGVSDCISQAEREGVTNRVVSLGMDRHMRRYWFLCRRIIIESDTAIFYYSTKEQFEVLLEMLDKDYYEKYVYKALVELQPEILKQMEITTQLTKQFQKERHSVFDAMLDPSACCQRNISEIMQSEVSEKKSINPSDTQAHFTELSNDNKDVTRLKSELPILKKSNDLPTLPKNAKYSLDNSFVLGKEGASKARFPTQLSSSHLCMEFPGNCCFKMGMEGSCFIYENHYATNSLSLSRHLYIEEKEKRRHLSYKFSIPLTGEFHWFGPTCGDERLLTNTFKETLLQLESSLLPCFMHPDWSLRKSEWLKKVSESFDVRGLSNVLVDLQMGIRPVLFNHIWHDALGHTSLKKMCSTDKEESRRRGRFEEEEIIYNSNNNEWVKYSLGVKHQLWKVKGEEFRMFGNGGWIWLSNSRKCKHISAFELGLRKIACDRLNDMKEVHKRNIGNCDSQVCSLENTSYYSSRNQPCTTDHKDLDNLTLKGDFSITDSILDGNFYFQPQKPPGRLDGLLGRRLKKLKKESELKEYFESLINQYFKNELSRPCVACMSTKNGANLIDENKYDNECMHVSQHLDKIFKNSLPLHEMKDREKALSMEDNLSQDISFLSSLSLFALKEMFKAGKLQMSKSIAFLVQDKLNLLLRTEMKVSLGKSQEMETSSGDGKKFPDRDVLSRMSKCLFALEKKLLRCLARKEGKMEVPGFNYNCKTNNIHWPYPAPRPLFKTAWQYRTQNSKSLASLGSHLRMMWACLKWDDLMVRSPSLAIHTVVTDAYIKSTEVLMKRDALKDHSKSEYLVRELTLPLADNSKIHEVYTPQRSGLRERRKACSTFLEDPTITDKWLSEESVELWQIKYLEERLEKDKIKMKSDATTRRDFPLKNLSGHKADDEHLSSEIRPGAQKITIIPKADGQIEIHGLQENQQILQLPNGDVHIATSLDTTNDAQNLAFILGPKIPLPQLDCLVVAETKSSRIEGAGEESFSIEEAHPSIIPRSSSTVSTQFLLQVVGQAMTHAYNTDIRERLLLMQKLIQQKSHSAALGEGLASEGHLRTNPGGGKVLKTISPALNQEEKEDQLRMAICSQVIRQLLDTIERNERLESKNLKKQEMTKGKLRQIAAAKLEVELQRRKEVLRRDILYKRTLMVQKLKQQIQIGIENERDQPNMSEVESESNLDERSLRSHKSSTSMPSDSETSYFSPKKKKHKPDTESASAQELYCLCKTPYDNSKFYIGCDRCQNWFHGSCVGITKPEAEKLSTYLCPNCRQPNNRSAKENLILTNSHWVEIEKVMNNLKTHRSAWPFLRPVDPKEAPDYYSIIAEPMDLSTVGKKVQGREYKLLPDFINDVMKIFENCRYYNARTTKFYKCADILEIYFSDKLRTLRTRLKIS